MTFSRIFARVVAAVDREVAAEQLDHGQIGGGLAVGDRGGLQDEPAVHAVGVGELPEEPRLAHARLPDHGDHLAVPQAGPVEGAAELLQLGVAADEAREPPPRPRPRGGCERRRLPASSNTSTGSPSPLTGTGPSGFTCDIALGELQRLGREQDGAGIGELLHPRGQVRRLADGRVVHVQIAADRAHDDFAGVEPDADLHGTPWARRTSSAYCFTDSCMRRAA